MAPARAVSRIACSSSERIDRGPIGVVTGVSDARSCSNTAIAAGARIPAQTPNDSAFDGPKTCRYRLASSRRASAGSISGGCTVRTVGCLAPSHRSTTEPVVVAYLSRLGGSPSAPAASPKAIVRPSSRAASRDARSAALRWAGGSSGNRPSVNTPRSCAATTYTLYRGPQIWTSAGSSHVLGPVCSTRALTDSTAARGMLSWRPAQAAVRNDASSITSRVSSALTRRRNARICSRVSASEASVIAART